MMDAIVEYEARSGIGWTRRRMIGGRTLVEVLDEESFGRRTVGRREAISCEGLTWKDLKGPKPVTSTVTSLCLAPCVFVLPSAGDGERGPASPIS